MTSKSKDEESAPEKSGSPSLALEVGRRTLAALAPYLARRHYRAGHVLWTEGETSGRLVLIEEIGITPETFSRALSRMVEAGVLHRLGPGKLQVLDENRLKKAAAGNPVEFSFTNSTNTQERT